MEQNLTSLGIESTIFKDKSKLFPRFTPDNVKGREKQYTKLLKNVPLPMINGATPNNYLLYGFHGSGKTLTIKLMNKEIINNTNIKVIFINCRNTTGMQKLYMDILGEFNLLQRTGISLGEHNKAIAHEIMIQPTVIILDEIDGLISAQDTKILYPLCRLPENYNIPPQNFSLILLTNNIHTKTEIDGDNDLRGYLSELRYDPYSQKEVYNILHDRSQQAFHSNVLPNKLLTKISSNIYTISNSNIREALLLMLYSGELAEDENKDVITNKHIKIAQDTIRLKEIEKTITKGNPITIFVLRCIVQNHLNSTSLSRSEILNELSPGVGRSSMPRRFISTPFSFQKEVYSSVDLLLSNSLVTLKENKKYRTREVNLQPPCSSNKILELITGIMEQRGLT